MATTINAPGPVPVTDPLLETRSTPAYGRGRAGDRRTGDMTAPPQAVPRDGARWALIGLFAVTGFTLSAWIARLPAVRDALGLSPAGLGGVLLAAAIGGLLATVIAPAVVTRLGIPGSVRLTGVLYAVAYVLLAVGVGIGSLAVVGAGLLVNGVAFAGGNLPLSLGSADVERRVGRPVLPQFHAAFSIGTVLGSLGGAAAAALAVDLRVQMVALAALALGWRWWAAAALPGARPRVVGARAAVPVSAAGPVRRDGGRRRNRRPGDGSRGRFAALREPRTVLIGVLALAASISEGAANDWLALGVVDGFGASESVAAATFAVFVAAMTLSRLAGTRLIERFGRVAVLRAGAVVSISGIVVFVTAPTLPLAVAGVAAWGLGTALNFPVLISAAADTPRFAALRVTVLGAFAGLAGFIEPPGLGALGEGVGVRTAVLAVAVVLLVVIALARVVAVERAGDLEAADDDVAPASGHASPRPSATGPLAEPAVAACRAA